MRDFVDVLLRDPKIAAHAVYRGLAPGRDALYAEPAAWPPGAREGLAVLGVPALYAHQARAVDLVAADRNVLLATPTASGKTLAYLLSYLARRAHDPLARAIFVYPLKALARDQLATIRRFLGAAAGLSEDEAAVVYDGDTAESDRRRIRKRPPAVVVTNPDMLHMGILPAHETWSPFFERLALCVLDEAHVYRGIFGAHVHHVVRRALRLARLHGASPQVVAGSATIGEPKRFAETLIGEPVELVGDSGAPAAPRHVVFLVPNGVSPYTVAVHALTRAIEAGHRSIAFTKARRITELMHQWLRQSRPDLAPRVASYRSGYLPEERREIERRLFGGELAGVISTSALEAGIDVGGLDVCVLVGYPGSLATLWQRIGRTGRKDRESLAVFVAMPDALDRYVAGHPEHFFSGAFERVVLDPQNDAVADVHLVSAGAERSLDPDDLLFLHGDQGRVRAGRLVEQGALVASADADDRWFALRRQPQRDVGLRSAGTSYELKRAGDGRPMGTIDENRAWFEGHPGAIYLHAGQTFRSLALDVEKRTITMEPCEVDFFTQVYARKETEILERYGTRELPGCGARLAFGRVKVTTFIEGYGRRRLFTQEEIARYPLDAPPQLLETISCWIEMPAGLLAALVAAERHPQGALHAMEHAAIGLFPLLAICDRWDLGGISYAHHPQLDRPAVFVYDGWPGGVGLARTGYERAEELLERTRDLLAACPCEDGCPACVHSPKCGSGNQPLDKAGALQVLEVLTGVRALTAPSAEDAAVAAEALQARLCAHRRSTHAGTRGGGPLPGDFFDAPDGPPGRDGHAGGDPARVGDEAARTVPAAVTPEPDPAVHWRWDFPAPSELLAPSDGRWLFFDVETLRSADEVGGWGNIRHMGLALAVVLDASTGAFRTYREHESGALVDDLCEADRVVGFNQERFDLEVLRGYAPAPRVAAIRSLDLMVELFGRLGFRPSLGHLAEETLGAAKSADGLQSLRWVKEGRFDLVERYCREDVLLTAALWAHGRARGHLVFRSRTGLRGRIPVRW